MTCAGCRRELEVGDHYIEGSASEFMGREDDGMDDLMGMILGSGPANKIIYCEDCTQRGGDFLLNTYYGDEEDSSVAS